MKKVPDAKYIEIVEEAKKMSDSLIQIKRGETYIMQSCKYWKKRKICYDRKEHDYV